MKTQSDVSPEVFFVENLIILVRGEYGLALCSIQEEDYRTTRINYWGYRRPDHHTERWGIACGHCYKRSAALERFARDKGILIMLSSNETEEELGPWENPWYDTRSDYDYRIRFKHYSSEELSKFLGCSAKEFWVIFGEVRNLPPPQAID